MRRIVLFLCLILAVCHALTAQETDDGGNVVPCAEFSKIFNNIKAICDRDNGNMWGVNLYAPVLCIDASRDVWSNQEDQQGQLQACGECFAGKYPFNKNVANTTVDVFGQKWVTMMLPLPADSIDRNVLFCHEMFHYWQDSLGHHPRVYNNSHMEAKDARILLKLEWKAFFSACQATDASLRKRAVRDGLTFRKQRQQKYSEFYPDETAFEVHEGLAEYTGIRLSALSDSMYLHILERETESYMKKENLVRSYAYLSGALIGYLLDASGYEWRKQVEGDSDLGLLLQKAYSVVPPADMEMYIRQRLMFYDYDSILSIESRRDSVQTVKKRQLTALFTQDVKELPLKNMQISFDPNTVICLEGIGNIYRNVRIVDDWGILETKGNGPVLITKDWKAVVLPSASSIEVNGSEEETEYWKLTAS